MTGEYRINGDGDRQTDFAILDMDPVTGIFQVSLTGPLPSPHKHTTKPKNNNIKIKRIIIRNHLTNQNLLFVCLFCLFCLFGICLVFSFCFCIFVKFFIVVLFVVVVLFLFVVLFCFCLVFLFVWRGRVGLGFFVVFYVCLFS